MVKINNYQLHKTYDLIAGEKIVIIIFDESNIELGSLTMKVNSDKKGVFGISFQEVDIDDLV